MTYSSDEFKSYADFQAALYHLWKQITNEVDKRNEIDPLYPASD